MNKRAAKAKRAAAASAAAESKKAVLPVYSPDRDPGIPDPTEARARALLHQHREFLARVCSEFEESARDKLHSEFAEYVRAMPPPKPSRIDGASRNVLAHILSFMPSSDHMNAASVCHAFRNAAHSSMAWRKNVTFEGLRDSSHFRGVAWQGKHGKGLEKPMAAQMAAWGCTPTSLSFARLDCGLLIDYLAPTLVNLEMTKVPNNGRPLSFSDISSQRFPCLTHLAGPILFPALPWHKSHSKQEVAWQFPKLTSLDLRLLPVAVAGLEQKLGQFAMFPSLQRLSLPLLNASQAQARKVLETVPGLRQLGVTFSGLFTEVTKFIEEAAPVLVDVQLDWPRIDPNLLTAILTQLVKSTRQLRRLCLTFGPTHGLTNEQVALLLQLRNLELLETSSGVLSRSADEQLAEATAKRVRRGVGAGAGAEAGARRDGPALRVVTLKAPAGTPHM